MIALKESNHQVLIQIQTVQLAKASNPACGGVDQSMRRNLFRKMDIRKKIISSFLLFFIVPLLIIYNAVFALFSDNLNRVSIEFTKIYMAQISTSINSHIDNMNNVSKCRYSKPYNVSGVFDQNCYW